MVQSDGRRAVRVAERIREELAKALERTIADPRLQGLVVTRVELSGDLQVAQVFVRLSLADDEAARLGAMRGLRSANARLRKAVGMAMDLRRIPELRFVFDEGQDAQGRILELLKEIERERQ